MSIIVECDICGKKYKFADNQAGRTVACKECGASLTLSGGRSRDAEAVAALPKARAKSSKGKKSSRGAGPLPFVLIGGGVLALGAVIVVVMIGLRHRNPAPANAPAAPAAPTASAASAAPGASGAANQTAASPTLPGTNLSIAPSSSPKGVIWSVPVDSPPPDWVLAEPPKNVTPGVAANADDVVYPTSTSPFVFLAGGDATKKRFEIWDLRSGTKTGSGSYENFSDKQLALSPDGKYFAFASKKPHQAQIVSTADGKSVRELALESEGGEILDLDFGPPETIICCSKATAGGKTINRLRAISIDSGALKWEQIDPADFVSGKAAFSPGRRYMASVRGKTAGIAVFDLQTGKLVGEATVTSIDKLGATAGLEALAFSPDGTQLAALAIGTGLTRVVVLDVSSGKIVSERGEISGRLSEVFPDSIHYKGADLDWLPDGSGWAVGGLAVLDAESGRLLWRFDPEHDQRFPMLHNWSSRRWVQSGVLVTDGPRNASKLKFVPINWSEIRALATQPPAENDQNLLVAPGRAVALKVELVAHRGDDAGKTVQSLTSAFTQRLESDQISVQNDQPAVLRVRHKEVGGQQIQFRGLSQPIGGGTSVEATKMQLEVAYVSADGKTTYWSDTLEYEPISLLIRGEANVKTVRDATFQQFLDRVPGLTIPYYLSKAKNAPMVPMVFRLPYKA